ncbi:MAG: aspartate--ammonia ligase [Fluviicola sp.]|nr:MAG: aspartate--ammonia ligase [Fluviicola sp.]
MDRKIETEEQISTLKELTERALLEQLNLTKVTAPLYVQANSGLNDNLNGVEEPVTFVISDVKYQIVHSLAKWKRWYLGKLNAQPGKGILANMVAIRKDEQLTSIHSNLVDQWDWEKVLLKEDRTIDTLINHGILIFKSLRKVEARWKTISGAQEILPENLKVIHTEDLLQLYPGLTPKERENAITREHGCVFLIGIGAELSNGQKHDLRAPDYDDWSTLDKNGKPGLNADILVWNAATEACLELSSMGIRVDENTLLEQLKRSGNEDRAKLPFHKAILSKKLPYTIGGGIGQSRVIMFFLQMKDIKHVQAVHS